MTIYVLILAILFVLSFIEIVTHDKKFSKAGFLFVVFMFFILSFIRWETGTDWTSYYKIYSWISVPWESFDNGMESGFNFVNHLGKMLFDSYTGVLFLFSVILYLSTIRFVSKLSYFPIATMLWYYCIAFAGMFYVRQNIALALLLVSLVFVDRKKFFPFLFFVFLASLFHRTAWIFLMVYPIYHRYYKTRTLILLTFLFVVVGLGLSKYLLSFIGSLGLGVVSKKLESYLEMGLEEGSTTISTTLVLVKGFINKAFLLFVYFVFLDKYRKIDKRLNGLMNVYLLGVMLYCITLPLSVSLARIAVYMDIVQIFISSYLLYVQKGLKSRALLFMLLTAYYSFRLYSSINMFKPAFIPFETIFDY